jgi:hypothetical protein
MRDEPILDQRDEYDILERELVYLLTDPDHYQPLWSTEEIGRELQTSDPMALINPLVRAGLLHRTSDGFVFATGPAVRMVQLVGQVV